MTKKNEMTSNTELSNMNETSTEQVLVTGTSQTDSSKLESSRQSHSPQQSTTEGVSKRPWLNSYDPKVAPEISIGTYPSLIELMEETFKEFTSNPCYSCMGKTLSFAQIEELSRNFASYLQGHTQLKPGDRIAIMMPNILQYAVALYGSLRAGLVVVNINPIYTARELDYQLTDAGCKAIVIFENAAHLLNEISYASQLENIWVTGVGDLLGFPKSLIVNAVIKYVKKMVPNYLGRKDKKINFVSFMHTLKEDHGYIKPLKVTLNSLAFLQYTGGTTGVSKGAELTHGNIVANLSQAKMWVDHGRIDKGKEIIITALPLYHIFSLTANAFAFFSWGTCNVLITNPRDFNSFITELKKWKFTVITGVNTLFRALLLQDRFHEVDFSKLKITLGGGMAVQKNVADEWQQRTGCMLLEAYGLTETSPAACINPASEKAFNGYVGLPIPNTDVAIKDDEENDLPFNQVGEICIRGPQVMRGYWNKPEETKLAFTKDGFFKTGDLGYMNEQGYVKIVDRKKDMILVSGFNVYPNEVEDVICTHPMVIEAAAIGEDDVNSGQIVKLFVVRKDPSLTETQVIQWCRSSLTSYKVPKKVIFKETLPKSNVGKILRRELKNMSE